MDTQPDHIPSSTTRRLPVGAEPQPDGGVHFRLWAPAATEVWLDINDSDAHRTTPEHGGYFSALVKTASAGARYGFRLNRSERRLPDPVSRFQPEGPHGLSEIVDPTVFTWTDAAWRGVPAERLVIYEMHVGTFTPEGSWAAAMRHLPALAELGITCIEMMPVADFPGRFGWGYDGVDLFAPTRLYGQPDDLRCFIDRAHALGLAVILDVVYNHFGPDGNYLTTFAPAYLTDRHPNEWGSAINFDGPDAAPVREFFTSNARYWIEEYHFDGLRLDATQQIFDSSSPHILAEIGRAVREAAPGRTTFIAAENETQTAQIARPVEDGGYGLDALWNDDLHHSAMVAVTGRREGHYSDFFGRAGEFVAAAKYGFLYQGQYYAWQAQPRGSAALDLNPRQFVTFLQNHDQIGNSAKGLRGHQLASPGNWRAITAYWLLSPGIPLLFQGQEFSASAPFLYFADHQGELGEAVKKGRGEFLVQFPSIAGAEMQCRLPDPRAPETFRRCAIDWGEREQNVEVLALHRDLLALRRELLGAGAPRLDGAALGDDCWLLRYFPPNGEDWLLVVNLGRDRLEASIPEPLLAPVAGRTWRLRWSSEHPHYGGGGVAEPFPDGLWWFPGQAAIVLTPGDAPSAPRAPHRRRTA
ncbi:MAG TPA: malto-oligosyltrehalose trehalohydrolase [Stellaceae bacterium]|jgi:maltooligosyltrehalose trehalohydrolase|nr:malto-oligosyltrehalose trehalohydrolase [Stellaceae bacterium]